MDKLTPELISAFGDLWPLVLISFGFILALIFRDPIKKIMQNLNKLIFKGYGAELTLEKSQENKEEVPAAKDQESISTDTGEVDTDVKEKQIEKISDEEQRELFIEMINHIHNKDLQEAEIIFHKLQDNQSDESKQIKNKITYFGLLFTNGLNSEGLNELIKIKDDNSDNNSIKKLALSLIASCYSYSSSYDKAIESYRE